MFCGNCGKSIAEDSVFCEFCGSKTKKVDNGKPKSQPKKRGLSSKNQTEIEESQENETYSSEETKNTYYYLLLREQAKKTANAEMLKGIGWAVLGGIITFVTYSMASDGGTYFVFWGLVVYGAYVFLRGLYYRISPDSLLKKALGETSEEDNKNEN